MHGDKLSVIIGLVLVVLGVLKAVADLLHYVAEMTENKKDDKFAEIFGKIVKFIAVIIDKITANSRNK